MSSWCSALRAAVPGAEPESQSVNAVAQVGGPSQEGMCGS